MFFKHVMIAFIILGILGYFYGDHLFYFQAQTMQRWQYPLPAYEAYERIVQYYPDSQFVPEAMKMMEYLRERNLHIDSTMLKKEKKLKKIQDERQKKESFH
eukprot:Anaeramoba_ignava/a221283_16.p2 GENE.a221283_16~~a221283_16.p2  ORF type:complete len:101 (+),score=10.05 a221283_16:386-688(+)